jgi:hypothetical protein
MYALSESFCELLVGALPFEPRVLREADSMGSDE